MQRTRVTTQDILEHVIKLRTAIDEGIARGTITLPPAYHDYLIELAMLSRSVLARELLAPPGHR